MNSLAASNQWVYALIAFVSIGILFLAMGFTPRTAMTTILCISAGFCLVNLLLADKMNNTLLFLLDIATWTVMNLWFDKKIKSRTT